MILHTNTITYSSLHNCLRRAALSYPPLSDAWFADCDERGSRSRERAFNFSLVAESAPGRRRKRNFQHVHHDPEGVVALTWDEWGMFLREVFELDPDARTDRYEGRADFHQKTNGTFEPHPWNVEHPVACGGCTMPTRWVADTLLRTALGQADFTVPLSIPKPEDLFGPLDMDKMRNT